MRRRPDLAPIAAWALIFALGGGVAADGRATGAAADLTISRAPATVVLSYTRDVGMLSERDPIPLLRLYGDGRYVVHHPYWMQKAGDWQGRIESAELTALVRSLVDGGLLELDAGSVKAEMKAREQVRRKASSAAGQPVQLFEVSDKEGTRISVSLERYKAAGVLGAAGEPTTREIVWWGLRHDARRHPEIRVLLELASFEERLRSLVESPDLERLEEGESHE